MRSIRCGRFAPLALALTLALAACNSGGGSGGGAPEPTAVSADAYAKAVCDEINAWIATLQTESESIGAEAISDPQSGAEVLADYFDSALAATEDMVAGVKAAGVPDVDGGEEVASQLNTAMAAVAAALEDIRARVDELPSDPAKFATEASDLATSIGPELQAAVAPLENMTNAELDAAFSENPSCNAIGQAPAA